MNSLGKFPLIIIAFLMASLWLLPEANASSTRIIAADSFTSSDTTKSYALPASSDTLAGLAATQTLTNKTISGASNTMSQLPVASQVIQAAPSGTVNGSNTSFTLSTTPVSTASVSLYLDGILLFQGSGNDYTISSATITMSVAPALGQKLIAVYSQY